MRTLLRNQLHRCHCCQTFGSAIHSSRNRHNCRPKYFDNLNEFNEISRRFHLPPLPPPVAPTTISNLPSWSKSATERARTYQRSLYKLIPNLITSSHGDWPTIQEISIVVIHCNSSVSWSYHNIKFSWSMSWNIQNNVPSLSTSAMAGLEKILLPLGELVGLEISYPDGCQLQSTRKISADLLPKLFHTYWNTPYSLPSITIHHIDVVSLFHQWMIKMRRLTTEIISTTWSLLISPTYGLTYHPVSRSPNQLIIFKIRFTFPCPFLCQGTGPTLDHRN